MKLKELIDRLNLIYDEHGDCDVLNFKNIIYGSAPVLSVEYKENIPDNEYIDDKSYMDNYNKEFHNVVIY